MTKIGLLSDTHGYWDERYLKYFEPCDEIWHAGDIGSMEIIERLEAFRPLRAVYGNIDGHDIRLIYPEINRFTIDGADVLMKHIGVSPGLYYASLRTTLYAHPPKLFLSGPSPILQFQFDPPLTLLPITLFSAGPSGFHHLRTLFRSCLHKGSFSDLEVIELNG